MTFEQATHFAETWGLVLLGVCFSLAVLYALWPSNRDQFARAARAPLNDGDDDDR
ncbi:MAG: cbb3-type cytochrome c oxidase subunit 3 [Terricaulis sp.]